ncbi:MAG: N-6 DNA methylase, partial [Chloroflexi bacterium]|nr:N-6 DNA methylase [Chloroflexota bacterium]
HDLGEYYTPDWLAERLLNQLGVDGDPRKRLLDPACGSGTFPVLTIKRIRQYADEKMLPPADVLDQILENVVGFDLNPLAVISARTNYLLALGDLLQHRRGEISIPVYLADSIMTPTAGADLFTQHAYSFNTAVGKFSVPRSLVDARYIDQLAYLLEESVGVGLTGDQFRVRLLHAFPLDAVNDAAEIDVALRLYEQLRDLDRQEINGIWARIIKNAFAPLFQGRFDYVAGNPPWVNWESLPDDYRQETKALWVHHGLFPHSGMDTILGKGKKDISMLMSYVAMDNYLKDGGRLGFLITQSVFKTAGAGQGFRRFRLGSGTPVAVVAVDDMANLKPFEGASNRTAIVVLERGRATKYPLRSYSLWYKPGGGSVIPEDVTLEDVTQEKIATYHQFVAEPVDEADPTSPWITGRRQALQAVKKVLGASDYRAYEGANSGGANAVYWLEIVGQRPDGLVVVSNITKGAKRKVDNVQAAIEPDLLYPLLRGRDVSRWQATPQVYILMVQDPEKRRGYDEDWLSVRHPKTYAYLKHFEAELRTRSGYRRYFRETDPFYSMFNVGDYTFAPYKVVWPWISPSLVSAVISSDDTGKVIVPEHNTSLVAFDNAEEAHFFCACFNSKPADFAAISSYSGGGGGIASPKVVERIRVPHYDPANPTHHQLAALSQQAHQATAAGDTARVREIEAEIDVLAAQLWELTEAELREIQESLEELG